jgi:hypothetical protein
MLAKTQKQPQCLSADEWTNKMCYLHAVEYYSALESKEIWTCDTTQVNLKDVLVSEII